MAVIISGSPQTCSAGDEEYDVIDVATGAPESPVREKEPEIEAVDQTISIEIRW